MNFWKKFKLFAFITTIDEPNDVKSPHLGKNKVDWLYVIKQFFAMYIQIKWEQVSSIFAYN